METMRWIEDRKDAMTVWDVAAVKWSALLLGVAIGATTARQLERRRGLIAGAGLGLAGWVVYRWFTAPGTTGQRPG